MLINSLSEWMEALKSSDDQAMFLYLSIQDYVTKQAPLTPYKENFLQSLFFKRLWIVCSMPCPVDVQNLSAIALCWGIWFPLH